ncbi:Centrosomin [Lucilia cuprina]|nr:Centrosomin [Lucilia cuprina]
MSSPKTTSASEAATGAGADAAEDFTKDLALECKPDSPSFVEYELIYNMTSFLEANGAEDVDKKVLRNMAVALTKHLNEICFCAAKQKIKKEKNTIRVNTAINQNINDEPLIEEFLLHVANTAADSSIVLFFAYVFWLLPVFCKLQKNFKPSETKESDKKKNKSFTKKPKTNILNIRLKFTKNKKKNTKIIFIILTIRYILLIINALNMSGIFRSNSTSNHTNDSTPNKHGVGYRSPCVSLQPYQGSTSPAAQGRSVREFEEQMATLRKENFNLKLRLYFIEESIPGYKQANNTSSEDTLMKQLIDTKVEMEILRKEVQEKQDLLKEAAQGMIQMEKILKESETKYQHVVEELNQKIQYLEMEREMEKSRINTPAAAGGSQEFNELMERSDLAENLNALQKLHELEGLLKQSDDKLVDFQQQIYSLEELLVKRDETIKEYEEKVKELVFQNNELLETIDTKDAEIANNESTISMKTENTARLLERIQDYEKMVNKMNIERNIVKRENRFFRTIISKLQAAANSSNSSSCNNTINNECYTFETQEIYRKYESNKRNKKNYTNQQTLPLTKMEDKFAKRSEGAAYKLKQKLCVNICNNDECQFHSKKSNSSSKCVKCSSTSLLEEVTPHCSHGLTDFNCLRDFNLNTTSCQGVGDYLYNYCWDIDHQYEPVIPIRYTISDSSLFGNNDNAVAISLTKSNSSSTSLTLSAPRFSSSLLGCCNTDDLTEVFGLKDTDTKQQQQQRFKQNISKYSALDGIRYAQQLREELQKHKMDAADKSCMIQDLEEKLKNRDQLYEKARLTIQKLMLSIKNQQVENSRLKNSTQASNVSNNEKEHQTTVGISGLECTGFCRSFSDTEALNDLTSLQKQKYDNIIEQQEVTIKNLKVEVKKKTADLQNLVNKELWEKNREIERLNKILNKTTTSPMSPQTHNVSHGEVNGELQQSFSDVEYTKALQRNKLLQRKVDILIQRLGTERQNDALIAQLQTELKQARLDAETAEKWRRQCADLCQTLSTRLEELAGFLNSLLKHKDVLGVLAVEKRKAMRRAVDRSLDLSKSLNMTLSVSGLSMIDQSLAELHNLSDILGDLDIDLENKTFNSHEDIHGQSIEILKAENKALKKELDKRRTADSKKERRSLPLPMMAENRESESEAWSEPDRKVSLARIGLEDHSASLMAKEQPLAAQHNETDSDYSESNSRSFKARSQERIAQLEQQLQQRDQRILEIQCQLVEADNRLKKENLKVLEANQELEQLKQRNEELHNDLIAIGSQEPSNINNESLLLRQIDEKSRSLEKLQEERERLTVESRLAEIQINSLKADMEIVKQTYEEALQQAAEREQQQLNALKQEMQQQLQQTLMEKQQEYKECLERDYIAKQLYEECSQQLNELQKQYIEAQRTIDCLQENEQELKQTLVESELTSRNLQKQIDESTLRASKAAMERVKALNDKLQLEKRVEELTLEINKHEEQRLQMQQQIDHLEQEQQSLHERLAVLQTKQRSVKPDDQNCQSGYTSEEIPLPHSSGVNAQSLVAQQRLGEQRIQNSSPDLGIESDAGRVSSVELNSVQRPQLKTVEMSPSSKQLSSTESDEKEGLHDSSTENIKPSNNNNSNTDANNGQMSIQQLAKKHDCLKVEQENAELRRKLLRTKRAFEDTYEKLRNANQRKAQIEKDIKNQILKTHNVLKNVRSNMENEL